MMSISNNSNVKNAPCFWRLGSLMIVHSGSNRPYPCTVRAQREEETRDESSRSFGIKRIGGRGRDRNGDPLLAKQA